LKQPQGCPQAQLWTSRQDTKTFAAAKSPVHQEFRASENPLIPMTLYPPHAPPSSTSTEQSPRHDERKRIALHFFFAFTHSSFPERQNLSSHTGFRAATMRQQPPSEKQRDRRTRRNEPSKLRKKVSVGAARDLHDGGNLPHELIRRNGLAIRQHVLLRNLASLGYQYPRVRPHTCQHQSQARTRGCHTSVRPCAATARRQ
jgi:hypothetical protein